MTSSPKFFSAETYKTELSFTYHNWFCALYLKRIQDSNDSSQGNSQPRNCIWISAFLRSANSVFKNRTAPEKYYFNCEISRLTSEHKWISTAWEISHCWVSVIINGVMKLSDESLKCIYVGCHWLELLFTFCVFAFTIS